MFGFGSLTFLAPWALAAAAALPLLWWLLRVTPPSPRLVRFPAVRLLFGLASREETPARTPWWLVLLRLLLAALLILAVAHPVMNAQTRAAGDGPVLIVMDDGWAAAGQWQRRQAALDSLLDQAERADRPVMLLPTAPAASGEKPRRPDVTSAAAARAVAQAMAPKPWPVDRAAVEALLAGMERQPGMRVVWLTDGIDGPGARELARRLQTFALTEALVPHPRGLARVLLPPAADANALAPRLRRAAPGAEELVPVRAVDGAGRTVARQQATIAAGATEATVVFDLPTELRNRVARFDVEDEASAATVVLLDERWRRRPVGIVAGGDAETAPLLADRHYAEKALNPFAELRTGSIEELLARPLSVALLPDSVRPTPGEIQRLEEWIGKGGVLVRFAGPQLSAAPDPLLPVRLRGGGGRTLDGALSWTAPTSLAPFPEGSPFAGLAIPDDVRVSSQVLAEPEVGLGDKTWARLEDGTPLVTAEPRGDGWLVLVHTTGNPTWSNLPLSGLFVDMLRRLVELSQGVAEGRADLRLAPAEVLDGFGRLRPPLTNVAALPAGEIAATTPSPRHPPGFYGDDSSRRALNLGPAIGTPQPLAMPSGVVVSGYEQAEREVDLKPWLLAAALILATIDTAVALGLRGLLARRAAAAGLAALLLVPPAPEARAAVDDFAMEAALETRLAYVRTGDPAVDELSRAGLAGLTQVLARRSTVEMAEPMGVDVENDPLLFFPLLYWPVTDVQAAPSAAAAEKIKDYMRHGGMILFDTRDQGDLGFGGGGAARLQELARELAIPPLAPVDPDHVLTRTFYLLRDMPGRYTGGTVWVERTNEQVNDGVSTVVAGGHDWAAAWAVDERGRPQVSVVPGGERQREMAYRFGVNLVMYALTGNYKGDQVHVPHILERLSR